MPPTRRKLLKLTATLGALAAVGTTARYLLLPPPRSESLASVDDLAAALMPHLDALPAADRAQAVVPYDHPYRQYYNRGLGGGGLPVDPGTLSWDARRILTDLYYSALSPIGRERVPNQFFVNWPGIHLMRLLVCGDPRNPPYQIILSGPHLNLRIGGASTEHAAFGGPQIYGDQRGNGDVGLPGNTYRYQLLAGQQLREAMTPAQRAAARVPHAPAQTLIDLQGRHGRFDGVPVAELSPANRALASRLVDGILENYPEADVAFAQECLAANGGVDGLHFADYDIDFEGGRRAGNGPSQIFRLEGPGAVFYFRGEPHLHAYLNVARDGDRPMSVGELLGSNPQPLAGEGLRVWFEAAMAQQTEADLGVYLPETVVGRLRAGPVRTGDIYCAESWQDRLVVVDVKGADLAPGCAAQLRARGVAPQSGSTYRIATTAYVAEEVAEQHLSRDRGALAATRPSGLVRDALIDHARDHGFQVL